MVIFHSYVDITRGYPFLLWSSPVIQGAAERPSGKHVRAGRHVIHVSAWQRIPPVIPLIKINHRYANTMELSIQVNQRTALYTHCLLYTIIIYIYIHIYIYYVCVCVGGCVCIIYIYIIYIYHLSLSLCASYILISAASSPIGFVVSRQRRKLHKRRLYKQLRSSNSIRRALFSMWESPWKMWENVGKWEESTRYVLVA